MIQKSELFKKHRENKLNEFFLSLEKHGDILLACRETNIDYFILKNWMKLDKEVCERIKNLCTKTSKNTLQEIRNGKRLPFTKKTPVILNAIFQSIQNGAGTCKACEFAGVNYTTFYSWLKEDEELRRRYEIVKDATVRIIENVFYQKLLEGRADTLAYIFFLTNRIPDSWKNRQELVHDIGESTIEKLEKLSVQQLKERASELINRGTPRININ